MLDAEPQLSPWKRLPRYRRVLLVVLAIAVLVTGFWGEIRGVFVSMLPKTATIRLIDVEGNTIPLAGRADVFELDRTRYLSSPRPVIGTIDLEGKGEVVVVDSEQFPSSLQVRFHVPGYGVDYASVELGKRREHRLRLGAPTSVEGVVRGVGGLPLKGARVLALGVAPRGVVVAETESAADGRFVLTGISARAGMLVLRVLKRGFAMEEREHSLKKFAIERVRNTEFRLTPVPPVRGVVRYPEGLVVAEVQAGVLNVPGVFADVEDDGSFTLHHLAVRKRYRLLVRGLPEGFAHDQVYIQSGDSVQVVVCAVVARRGIVVSKSTGRRVPGAKVWHNHSTRGSEVVHANPSGEFTLRSIPLGDLSVSVEIPVSPDFPRGGVEHHRISVDESSQLRLEVR
ncbi:MAG: carboxypeptidase-like regulatory domain-containing protein [Planctomycetota bacterium]|nr:carboxypeptidase-like regulatory domain-containing protein [Planctomycetota bacterium]